jgi:hypothetical protein
MYRPRMSPTLFREGPYRFYFFSREETRLHVHVSSGDGEAKFWIEPDVELAGNFGIPEREITKVLAIVRNHEHEIREAWNRYFGS